MIPSTTLREVLQTSPSAGKAARLVGVHRSTLRALAYRNDIGDLYEECARRGAASPTHITFIDMTGRRVAGVEVIERKPGTKNASWLCRFPACGHEAVYEGIYLRRQEKVQQDVCCKVCPPEQRPKGVIRSMQTIMVNATERVVADHQELTYELVVHLSGKPERSDYTVTARSLSPEGISLARTLVAGQSFGRADACRQWVFNIAMTGGA